MGFRLQLLNTQLKPRRRRPDTELSRCTIQLFKMHGLDRMEQGFGAILIAGSPPVQALFSGLLSLVITGLVSGLASTLASVV